MNTELENSPSSTKKTPSVTLWGIKNCSTMKKACAWLDAQGVTYQFIDYKKVDLAAELLPDWNRRVGWQTLLNKQGLTWKRLSDAERSHIDEAQALSLMSRYPTLIKRPVLDTGKHLLIGFSPETYATVF